MRHVHRCQHVGCAEFVECDDDCREDDQESICYCPEHECEDESLLDVAVLV